MGNFADKDAYAAFNMGIGFVVVSAPDHVEDLRNTMSQFAHETYVIGNIVPGVGKVQLKPS